VVAGDRLGYTQPMGTPAKKLSPEAEALFQRARSLPNEEQRDLAERILLHVEPPELSPAWKSEIARRLKSIDDGTAVLHDHDDMMRELLAKYGG
jgi:hypothetical protein